MQVTLTVTVDEAELEQLRQHLYEAVRHTQGALYIIAPAVVRGLPEDEEVWINAWPMGEQGRGPNLWAISLSGSARGGNRTAQAAGSVLSCRVRVGDLVALARDGVA